MSPAEWSWSLEAMLPLALAVLYVAASRRFPGDRRRTAAFLSGCGLLALAVASPLDTLAREYLVLGHLWQNVVLAEWAPLLLVVGLPSALAARLTRGAVPRGLTNPFVALPLWAGTYALWHLPPFYDAALRHPHSLLVLEHATYVAAGVLLWWPVLQDAPRSLPSQSRAAYVFAAFVLSAPLGLVLALVPRPIYAFYADAPERVWGLSRLADQQFGGISMAAEQSLVFFAAFAYWFLRFLAEEERGGAVDRLEAPE